MDNHLGVVGGVLRDHLPAGLRGAVGLHGRDPDALGGDVDDQVEAAGARCSGVAGRLRLHRVEARRAEAQGVVEAPPRGRIELEGPDLAGDDAVEAVVLVCRLRLHADVGADVVGGDLVHVGRHSRDVHWQVPDLALPFTPEGYRQPALERLRGGDQHACLEEATALQPEREAIVALALNIAEENVLLAVAAWLEPPLREVLQVVAQPLQIAPVPCGETLHRLHARARSAMRSSFVS
mmetsp:Transcript_49347/g.132823  ORF Transcript_49347/g.132823 Transcript_49347/m.132823 type:complete len:237 (-) Transcript_49347:66-776(-)